MLTETVLSLSVPVLAMLAAIFVLGGIVKGVVGIGLPLVLIPLLTPVLDMPVAVALLTVPMIANNIGQAMIVMVYEGSLTSSSCSAASATMGSSGRGSKSTPVDN